MEKIQSLIGAIVGECVGMKKFLAVIFIIFAGFSTVFSDTFSAFNAVLDNCDKTRAADMLGTFTEDFGQAISGGSFGLGSSLGVLGIYASAKYSYQQARDGNEILKEAGAGGIGIPIAQFVLGLTSAVDAIARIGYSEGATVFGWGARYQLVDGASILPTISIQSVYTFSNTISGENKFDAWNFKNSFSFAFTDIPLIQPYFQPYFFVSYDYTELTAKSSFYEGMSSSVSGIGYGAGASISIKKRVNLSASISMYEDEPNWSVGLYVGI
ncbi:MAG: hypothetical protein LBU55_04605 [Elusimicrobiota bacterium]|jgi:hypothetical protein|nr:hypothetical protein [Elusimicrobiota bacterium]